MIKELEKIENFDMFLEEILDIIEDLPSDQSQIMVQGLDDNFNVGTGRIGSLENQNERDYVKLNPLFENTILSSYVKKYNAFRTRIMIMPEKHCYSVHMDPTFRIHIPLITSDQAWMVWPYNNTCSRMLAGTVYWVNTKKFHSFFNGAKTKRIHVVMCVDN